MKISEVTITRIKPRQGIVAFASVVINDDIYVGSIAVHQKATGGFRLTYPTKKSGGLDMPILYPINRTAGQAIEQAIITQLNKVMRKATPDAGHNRHIHP